MRLEMIIKAIQFINIQNGISLIKVDKNQNVCTTELSIRLIAWIQSAFSAIYGQITKLKTVIGMRIIKYNFSVARFAPKETWILPQA